MRNNIVHDGADSLTYEIRGIVAIAKKCESFGLKISWENIGDPVAKGERVPDWVRDIVAETVAKNELSFAYSPTKGVLETREFIAAERNRRRGVQITAEDILFFNGLGDAISRLYSNLNERVRVIGPDPAYPTHSSAEAAHAGSPHLTYKLDPENNWYPNIEDIERQIEENPAISGIVIINPDNPTGMVYPKKVLLGLVALAKKHGLFIISDEIYGNLAYNGEMIDLGDIIGDVPGIALRGLSKEVPWPGARCGWAEFYNTGKDPVFAKYVKSLVDAKMLEVCSTTLPQTVLPKILSDARYAPHLASRREIYKGRAERACKILLEAKGIKIVKPRGAYYMTVVFDEGVLSETQSLHIENPSIRKEIEKQVTGASLDKRFVYYLLGATGICVVPLSGFNSARKGFRLTLLEQDRKAFEKTMTALKEAIERYTAS